MNGRGKKWLLWGSLITFLISIGGVIYTSTIPFSRILDRIQTAIAVVLVLSILNLLFLLADRYRNKIRFRNAFRILSYFLPVLILLLFSIDLKWLSINSDHLYGILIFGILLFIAIATIYLFVLNETNLITGIIVILFYIISSLVLKRINLGDPETHLEFGFIMIGCGMYLFGLKCIFIIEKNRFLKSVSFFACLLIYFGSLLMISLSSTYVTTTIIIYSISIFLLTLIVLLTLPLSGYIEWSSLHKSILKKILIPWIFFLVVISIRFVFPDLNSLFFRENQGEFQEFIMDDYPVINKNGLEPE